MQPQNVWNLDEAARQRACEPVLALDEWMLRLPQPPSVDSALSPWATAEIRLWQDVEPVSYPAIDHHCLTLHLGSPRQITRRGEGRTEIANIRSGSLSVTPCAAVYDWRTTGPVDYAELYVSPTTLRKIWGEIPDTPPSSDLSAALGITDPLIESLFKAMLAETRRGSMASSLYLDSLFSSLWLRLLRSLGPACEASTRKRASLCGKRLERVLSYIEDNLTTSLTVADLAAVAALSPFHFSRAFSSAIGSSPYAYVMTRRVQQARQQLLGGRSSDAEVIAACGFKTNGQFSRMFKREIGITPAQYRRELRSTRRSYCGRGDDTPSSRLDRALTEDRSYRSNLADPV